MNKFIRILGSIAFTSIGVVAPAMFVLAAQNGNKFAAIILGITTILQWATNAMLWYFMSEE